MMSETNSKIVSREIKVDKKRDSKGKWSENIKAG